jgi:hypothetical protein
MSAVSLAENSPQQAVHGSREIMDDFESAGAAQMTLKQIGANLVDIISSDIARASTIAQSFEDDRFGDLGFRVWSQVRDYLLLRQQQNTA